jgi:mannose-6-phosphate isomerase-like protein (cupin superfamily)
MREMQFGRSWYSNLDERSQTYTAPIIYCVLGTFIASWHISAQNRNPPNSRQVWPPNGCHRPCTSRPTASSGVSPRFSRRTKERRAGGCRSSRHFEADWISMAPGEKPKTVFYADDRVFWIVESGQMRVNIEGQAPFLATKGFLVQAAPRLPTAWKPWAMNRCCGPRCGLQAK